MPHTMTMAGTWTGATCNLEGDITQLDMAQAVSSQQLPSLGGVSSTKQRSDTAPATAAGQRSGLASVDPPCICLQPIPQRMALGCTWLGHQQAARGLHCALPSLTSDAHGDGPVHCRQPKHHAGDASEPQRRLPVPAESDAGLRLRHSLAPTGRHRGVSAEPDHLGSYLLSTDWKPASR